MSREKDANRREDIHFRILRMLEKKPQASQREIATELGVSLGGVNYCLNALIEKGHINYVLNAHEYDIFPLAKIATPRFAAVWLRRWRELLLSAHIIANLAVRRGFDIRRHLPQPPPR